jgi:hypothetical protein
MYKVQCTRYKVGIRIFFQNSLGALFRSQYESLLRHSKISVRRSILKNSIKYQVTSIKTIVFRISYFVLGTLYMVLGTIIYFTYFYKSKTNSM